MNSKKKLRIKVLNSITATTFVIAIIFTFIDVKISYMLLSISFFTVMFSYFIKLFWSQVKQIKQK